MIDSGLVDCWRLGFSGLGVSLKRCITGGGLSPPQAQGLSSYFFKIMMQRSQLWSSTMTCLSASQHEDHRLTL